MPLPLEGFVAVLDSRTDAHGLRTLAPQALVAPLDTALDLAGRKLRGDLDLPSLELALVLTRLDENPLAPDQRDLIWRAFGVPVFEQLQDQNGRTLARECEVHDGLHVDAAASLPAALAGELVNGHCECGNEAPRLQRKGPARQRAAAAAAGARTGT